MSEPTAAPPRRLPLLLTGVVVAAFGAYLFQQREYIAAQYALRPGTLLVIASLTTGVLALRALQNRLVFGRLGVSAPWRDWFGLVCVTSFTNYLPLSAGLLAKGVYLNRVHATPYATFAVGQLAILLLVLVANGLTGSLLLAPSAATPAQWALLAGFAVMLASGALLWLPEGVARPLEQRFARWIPAPTSTAAIRRSAPAAILSQLAILALMAQSLRLAFAAGDVEVGLGACLVFAAVLVLTSLVSITPGAIGTREFLLGGLAVWTGFELRDAVIASTLARLGEMIAIFGFGSVYSYRLSQHALRGGGRADPSPPSARPRVLFVTYNFPPKLGGLEQVVHEVWQALGERAELVTIAQHGATPPAPGAALHRPRLPGLAAFLVFALATGRRLAGERRFDVVVAGSALVALPVWLAARRQGSRAVALTYGLDTIHPSRVYQGLYRLAMPRMQHVIAISRATRDEVLARGVARERVSVLPPGCHGRAFASPDEGDVQALRQRWGLEGARVILSAGRLVRRKGVDAFVRHSLPRVVERVPDAVLLLAGGNPEGALAHGDDVATEVAAAARDAGMEDRVIVTGRLPADEIAGAFQLADVFVLPVIESPGDMEGFGIVLLEAAAAGLPVVATRLGGIPDAVADGETGVLVSAGDYDAMAAALAEFLSDESRRAAFSTHGRQRVMEGFLWRDVAPRWAARILEGAG